MRTNRVFFDRDDVLKIRYYRDSYKIEKNKISTYFETEDKSKISLTEEMFFFYLPFLISIDYQGGDVGKSIIVLFPFNIEMEISDKFFDFLISE